MHPVMAHSLGIAGEFLNLLGAFLLGVDMFLRGDFRRHDAELLHVRDFVVRNNVKSARYRNVTVAAPDFRELIAERRARKYGFAGALLLFVGFALLVGYHAMEIW